MRKVANLRELNVSLGDLYQNKGQINIHLSDKPYRFYVILLDVHGKIDCKLSSIGANLWTRTNKGMTYKKYTRIQDLQTAIKKQIHRKIETEGKITFSLCQQIGFM